LSLDQTEGGYLMKSLAIALFAATAMTAGAAQAQESAGATFIDPHGAENGTAELTATSQGVLIELEVSGLPAGQWVAFHVHEEGSCDHETDHESAGDHFNPTGADHGYHAEGGPHAGDMPNQYVGDDGVLRAQVFNSFVTLGEARPISWAAH
jgi:superoxide dismutase, Cu-Zn family